MTNEQAKSELMQIYGSLSEEKKQALDVLMAQADVTDDDIATMGILFNADIECLCNQGRFNDAKEMEQIRDRLMARLQADGDLISRTSVLDVLKIYKVNLTVIDIIRGLPITSVAIPKKTGRWIDQDEGAKHSRECNQCGKEPLLDEYGDYVFSKYCPNCGKKMDCTTLD